MLLRALVPLAVTLLTSGCSGLLHSSQPPEQTYFLRAKSDAPRDAARPVVDASLRVVHPLTDPGLDSPRIVLVQSDRRMNFYAASQWPAPLSNVVESLTIETLRASGSWTSIEGSTSPFPSDYVLQIAVRRFEADYTSGAPAPEVHVVLDCILGRREGRDVIASFIAEGSSVAAANRLTDVIAAFETAANAALASLSQHSIEAVHSDLERGQRAR